VGRRSDGGRHAGVTPDQSVVAGRTPHRAGPDDVRPVRRVEADDDVRPDPDVDLADLDRDTLRELRSLGLTGNRVGKHLLTAASVVDTDPEEALRQLRAAVRRGARLPVVRETAGVVAYAAGDFALALRELRTATRLGVGNHLLPLIVDCERALGRPDRALELAAEAVDLDPDTAAELAIVVSGIHRDAGDAAAALADLGAAGSGTTPAAGLRVRYARAEALLATGDSAAADDLFDEVARQDSEGITDAAERVAAAHGLLFDDVAEDDVDDRDDQHADGDLGVDGVNGTGDATAELGRGDDDASDDDASDDGASDDGDAAADDDMTQVDPEASDNDEDR
jgi:tetratricopeptide (TPR) repeat protein